MVKVLIIRKSATVKEKNVELDDLENLHSICGFSDVENFSKRTTWKGDGVYISLYAKDDGSHKSINKTDLPPPLDNELYYGKMLLVKHKNTVLDNDECMDLTEEEWDKLYDALFGGFEILGNEDSEEEEDDEEDNIPDDMKTKEGYVKDGFVVEDDDEEDEDYVEEEECEEESEEEYTGSDEESEEEEEGSEYSVYSEEEAEEEETEEEVEVEEEVETEKDETEKDETGGDKKE